MAVKSTSYPTRHPDGPWSLMVVTFYSLFDYGEELAAAARITQRSRPAVEKPFFAATAFGFTGSILAQPSADSDPFWQVYARFERGSAVVMPMQHGGRSLRKEPKRVHRSEREGCEQRGVPQRPCCGDGRAEARLAMLAVALRAATGRERFSGSAGQSAGVDPPHRPADADATPKR
jgi:hypothetical protein